MSSRSSKDKIGEGKLLLVLDSILEHAALPSRAQILVRGLGSLRPCVAML
jgi:hypothetical protein